MNLLALAAIIFLASFVNSVSGFGFGLLAMGLLGGLLDLQTASPTVALLSTVVQIGIFAVYRQSFDLRAVVRLAVGSIIGVPIGIWLLDRVDQTSVLHLLGGLLIAYALYALLNLRLPRIERPALAYPFGLASGILSGLYNIGGPPVVIYGTCRDWPPDAFRSNLQGFFFVSNAMVLVGHFVGQHMTQAVVSSTAIAVLPALIGTAIGIVFNRHLLRPTLFRQIVYVALALIGLRLLV